DGDIDLFGTLPSTRRVAWFENDGQRYFSERVVGDSYYAHEGAELVDFDRDGDIDVVASEYNGRLGWFQNDGAGHFSLQLVENSRGLFMRRPSVADVNADGNLDIVVSGYVPSRPSCQVGWHENEGSFSFSRPGTEIDQ